MFYSYEEMIPDDICVLNTTQPLSHPPTSPFQTDLPHPIQNLVLRVNKGFFGNFPKNGKAKLYYARRKFFYISLIPIGDSLNLVCIGNIIRPRYEII